MLKLILHHQAKRVPTRNEGEETNCFVEENLNQEFIQVSHGRLLPNEEGLMLLQRLLLLVKTSKCAVNWLKLLRSDTLQLVLGSPGG